MKVEKICHLIGVFLCIFFWQTTLFSQVSGEQSDSRKESDAELNLIHLGDLLEIDVVGSIEYDWRGSLTPEGFLNGPEGLSESVYGLCRSEEEVALEIARNFSKILRDPKVAVRILDRSNRPASTVYGAVKTPQRLQIKRPVFLNEIIVLSGGFTENASGEIQVFRPLSLSCAGSLAIKEAAQNKRDNQPERFIATSQEGGSKSLSIKISDLIGGSKEANIQILGGDIITVLEARPVYVIGGVTTPKQIATRSSITVSRAVASAGGLTKNADGTKVTIYRRSGGATKLMEIDLEKIKSNQSEDLLLEPFDILEVAQKGREKRKIPPVISIEDLSRATTDKLPLRVID